MEDSASTIAGGGAGIALLLTVRWEAIPYREAVKLGVALALAIMGYLMYRERKQTDLPLDRFADLHTRTRLAPLGACGRLPPYSGCSRRIQPHFAIIV